MQQTHSDRVRVLTPGHRFIGYVNTKEASRAIFLGLAVKHNANRHRLISVIDLSAKIDVPRQPASLSTTYDEKLVDTYHLQMMKRASGERGSHSFCLWDPWLRFSEARAGRIISEETQRRRMEKKREAAEQSKFAVTGNVHMESWPANPNTAKSNIPVESPWPSGHTVELP